MYLLAGVFTAVPAARLAEIPAVGTLFKEYIRR